MPTLVDHSVGIAVEPSHGTETTPTRFYEWTLGSSLDSDPKFVQGAGIRQGSAVARTGRRVGVVGQGSGSLQFDVLNRGFGLLLQSVLGSGTSTLVSAGVYQQLFTLGSGTTLPALTIQEGIVRPDGTTDAYTWAGSTLKNIELACGTGAIVTAKVDVDALPAHVVRTVADGATTNTSATLTSVTAAFTYNDIGRPVSGTGIPASTTILSVESATSVTMSANATATATGVSVTIGLAYATPSYPTASGTEPFHYGQLRGTLGGTLTAPTTTALASVASSTALATLRAYTLNVENEIADDRWNGALQRNQPTIGTRGITLSIDTEYDSTTGARLREAQLTQADIGPIVLTHTGVSLASGFNAVLQIVIPSAKIDSGAIPMPSDDKPIVTSVKYSVLDNLTASSPLYVVVRTADTAL